MKVSDLKNYHSDMQILGSLMKHSPECKEWDEGKYLFQPSNEIMDVAQKIKQKYNLGMDIKNILEEAKNKKLREETV
jgi:hypothetical protein